MNDNALTEKELLYGDVGYTGETQTNVFDLDYYRNKIREFQTHLNALAATAETFQELREKVSNEELIQDINTWIDDFRSNKSALLMAAEAVNAAAQSANAVGVRMPVLQIPQRLAALPPLAIAAIAGAVAGTAWAISYAVDRIAAARTIVERYRLIEGLPDNERAAIIGAEQQIVRAQANAESPLGSLANTIKWIALAVAGFFVWRAIERG